jgi:outer membrane protein assembly factor BamB
MHMISKTCTAGAKPMQRMLLPIAVCGTILLSLPLRGDDWPQWRGPQRDGVWRETGIVSALPDKLPIRWRAPIGPGYCGPSVADGRVFCMDKINAPNSQERIVCLDAANGNLLWEYAYDCRYTISYTAGPRATVTVEDGQVYALGAQGHLHCLDAEKGTVLWQRDLAGDFQLDDRMPIWGIAGAPLIADDLLVVQLGAPQACIVALHKRDGSNAWQALDDRACYAAPLLIEQAGQTVLVCWTGDSISALDPATGSLHWRFAFPPTRMPIGIATPLVKDHQLFVTSFYDGSLMLKLAADQLKSDLDWQKRGPDEQNTEALHSIISTPIWLGDHIYGVGRPDGHAQSAVEHDSFRPAR